jgi:hypothetical protein
MRPGNFLVLGLADTNCDGRGNGYGYRSARRCAAESKHDDLESWMAAGCELHQADLAQTEVNCAAASNSISPLSGR